MSTEELSPTLEAAPPLQVVRASGELEMAIERASFASPMPMAPPPEQRNVTLVQHQIVHHHHAAVRGGENGPDGDEDEEENDPDRNRDPIVVEGGKMGKCEVCSRDIHRDTQTPNAGEGITYHCCCGRSGCVVLHEACAYETAMRSENLGRELVYASHHRSRARREKCQLRVPTEVALFRAAWELIVSWPWAIVKILLAAVVLAYVLKACWFVSVASGTHPVDAWNNHALIGANKTTGDPITIKPKLSLSEFRRYNFCKPSYVGFDWLCPMLQSNCDGNTYCSRGGFNIDGGHFLMALYFFVKYLSLPMLAYRRNWHLKILRWTKSLAVRPKIVNARRSRGRAAPPSVLASLGSRRAAGASHP